MKKFFYSMFAVATMLLATTSCQKDEWTDTADGEEVNVTFTASLEDAVATRAIGDGETAKYLYFGAYDADGNYIETLQPTNLPSNGKIQFAGKKATVNLRLVKGQTYKFLFWAQSTQDETYYKVDFTNKQVKVQYTKPTTQGQPNKIAANDEKRDAFWTTKEYTITGPLTENIVLKRPFAQVNVGIEKGELAEATAAGVDVAKSSFYFNEVATTLNVFTGAVEDKVAMLYEASAIPAEGTAAQELKNVAGKDYEYIAMNYILVADGTAADASGKYVMSDAAFTIGDAAGKQIKEYKVPNLPVQRNWRTNIIGSIMSDAQFNIVIDPIFTGDHNYPEAGAQELAFAALNGGQVTLSADVTLTKPLEVKADMVIDLNGKTIKGDGLSDRGVIEVTGNATVTIKGDGAVTTTSAYPVLVDDGTLNLEGGSYTATNSTQAVYVRKGVANISGGYYEVDSEFNGTSYVDDNGNGKYVLNLWDANGKNGSAKIVVTGGTFKKFNPADNAAENPKVSFVADGYASYLKEVDGDNVYEVKKATGAIKLTEDMTVTSLIIPEGATVNYDLNGKTLTVLNNGLVNHGEMTLKGGKITSLATEESRRNIYNYGTMVIDGTEFTQQYNKKGAAINNEGKLTIEDATVNAVFYSIWTSGKDAETIVNGGTFTTTNDTEVRDTWAYAVNVLNGAKLTINGGSFTGNHGVIGVVGGSVAVLNGGTFNCTAGYTGNSDWALYASGEGSVIYYDADNCTITSSNPNGSSITVNNGAIVPLHVTDSADEVATNLEKGENVTLSGNVSAQAVWKMTGGAILDGAGNTLTMDLKASTASLALGIQPDGGTIKNLTIEGNNERNASGKGYRAIYITKPTEDVVIDNVHIDGVAYPINTGTKGTVDGLALKVSNSTLVGWTSFSGGFASASFTNCVFAIGDYYQDSENPSWDGCVKPYIATTFEGCTFEQGFCIDLSALAQNATVTMKNCKVGNTVLTKDNIALYLAGDVAKVTF